MAFNTAPPSTEEKKGWKLFKNDPNKPAKAPKAPKAMKEKAPKKEKEPKAPKAPKEAKADETFKHVIGPDGKTVKNIIGQPKKKPRAEFQNEIDKLSQENGILKRENAQIKSNLTVTQRDLNALKQWSRSAPVTQSTY